MSEKPITHEILITLDLHEWKFINQLKNFMHEKGMERTTISEFMHLLCLKAAMDKAAEIKGHYDESPPIDKPQQDWVSMN